jgi:hypothetical protein
MPAKARFREQASAIRDLKVGDIVLVHAKTVLGKLVRSTTKSHWSHVALVFDIIDISDTEKDVLIVEAAWFIEIHRLSVYLNEPDVYELGFKRMSCLTDEERDRFRGYFLDAVDTPYDARRLMAYFFRSWLAWIYGMNATLDMARRYIDTQNFICTSFAQRSYYLAVSPDKRGRTLFRKDDRNVDFLLQMEQITPADIARSQNTAWLYNPRR